jgi:hypothetical protein
MVTDRKFETEALRRLLSKLEVGQVVSFYDLSVAACMHITCNSAPLISARRIVLNEDRIVLESVRGVGYRRANDVELATEVSDRDLRKSRRHAGRALKKLACVENFSQMPNHAQIAHTIKASFFGAVKYMAHKSTLNRVVAPAVAGRSSELPVKETLRAFTGK